MDSSSPNKQGLTLIGVLVAITLLVASIIAIANLYVRTTRVASASRERFIATNLAREGLELVQMQRDTNWLQIRAGTPNIEWTSKICDNSFASDRAVTVDFDSTIDLEVQFNEAGTDDKLYRVADGHWRHYTPSGEATRFDRVITVDCSQREAATANAATPSLITVTATVSWQERTQVQNVSLKTRLYDWYPTP